MRKLFLSLFLFFVFVSAWSQHSSIKGTIVDTVENKNLRNTVISLMRASDSVLVKFTRAGQSGQFAINGLDSGQFVIMITHPLLGDYFDKFELPAATEKELGKIFMTPKSKLLAEVILKSGSPIRIKGDTTVYTADSFKVRPGANVEELLRRLPGITVDKDGQITAMGERVKKVLVDGEEFFGSDPGIATKNLRADVVKEVEVFDKKSDQAEFTGIDDGVKDKTINLKLKDDKKKGYFGKVEAGGGSDERYNNSVMMNAFKAKRKLAAYGIMSNTGQTNLDWQDAQNYGGGMDGMESGVTEDGGMYISISTPDDENYSGGRNGIPVNWNAGLHYSNKFNDGKQSLNTGYKFSQVDAPGITSTFSKTFLPDTSWSTNTISDNFSSRIKHSLNMIVDATLDSMNSLKWTTNANENNLTTNNKYYAVSLTNADSLNNIPPDSINNINRLNKNKSNNVAITSTLLWRHKFKKLSRTLSVNTDFTWSRSKSDGQLYSLNRFFSKGAFAFADTLDQKNIANAEAQGFTSKIAYTEPWMKDVYLEFSYAFSYNNNINDRITRFDDGSGKYEEVIDSLSNYFLFKRFIHTPGASIRVNKKKYNFSIGGAVGFSQFTQEDLSRDEGVKYNFVNFFPRASFVYKFKPNQNFRFNYNGSTTAPSLQQLQPIRVNTDRLNNYVGNPALKQSFRHNFNIGYNSYNILKERNIWTNLSINYTQNAFTQFSSIDSTGARTYQTVNANGVYYINFYSNYGFKIPDTKWRISFGPNLNMRHNVDFVKEKAQNDAVKNITNANSYGMELYIGQYVENKYNFNIGPRFSWNTSTASVNTSANAEYWQIEGWASGNLTFLKTFEIGTDINFQARQKDPRFPEQNSFTTWNGYALKRLLKNELEVKFGVYDILNQNRGYQRNFNSYSFTESYYNTLKRFWLLSVTWNFSKNGKPASW